MLRYATIDRSQKRKIWTPHCNFSKNVIIPRRVISASLGTVSSGPTGLTPAGETAIAFDGLAERGRKGANRLTPQQRKFVDCYLAGFTAEQAAIEAGYSAKNAAQQSTRLLGNQSVKTEIKRQQDKRSKKLHVTADRIVEELARIAFSDLGAAVSWGPGGVFLKDSEGMDIDIRRALAEVSETSGGKTTTRRVKLHDKLRALDLLGKYLGMFRERVELTGQITLSDLADLAARGPKDE